MLVVAPKQESLPRGELFARARCPTARWPTSTSSSWSTATWRAHVCAFAVCCQSLVSLLSVECYTVRPRSSKLHCPPSAGGGVTPRRRCRAHTLCVKSTRCLSRWRRLCRGGNRRSRLPDALCGPDYSVTVYCTVRPGYDKFSSSRSIKVYI